MDAKAEITIIRSAIKAQIPTVSVRNNRGTAWGWVGIRGSGGGGMFTEAEREGLKALGLTPGGNYCNIAPDARSFWVKRLTGQGQARPCIICRQEAVASFACPCDLMHWTCEQHTGKVGDCATLAARRG